MKNSILHCPYCLRESELPDEASDGRVLCPLCKREILSKSKNEIVPESVDSLCGTNSRPSLSANAKRIILAASALFILLIAVFLTWLLFGPSYKDHETGDFRMARHDLYYHLVHVRGEIEKALDAERTIDEYYCAACRIQDAQWGTRDIYQSDKYYERYSDELIRMGCSPGCPHQIAELLSFERCMDGYVFRHGAKAINEIFSGKKSDDLKIDSAEIKSIQEIASKGRSELVEIKSFLDAAIERIEQQDPNLHSPKMK